MKLRGGRRSYKELCHSFDATRERVSRVQRVENAAREEARLWESLRPEQSPILQVWGKGQLGYLGGKVGWRLMAKLLSHSDDRQGRWMERGAQVDLFETEIGVNHIGRWIPAGSVNHRQMHKRVGDGEKITMEGVGENYSRQATQGLPRKKQKKKRIRCRGILGLNGLKKSQKLAKKKKVCGKKTKGAPAGRRLANSKWVLNEGRWHGPRRSAVGESI